MIPWTVNSYGRVIASQSLALRAQSDGVITAIHIQPGQSVKKGSVLFSMTANDTNLSLKNLGLAADLAKELYERKRVITKKAKGFVWDTDLLEARAKYHEAQAQYEAAKAVQQIVAPISGKMSTSDYSVGDYVKSGEQLAYILNEDTLQIEYELPNSYMDQVAVGQPILFYPQDSQDSYAATVSYVAPALSRVDDSIILQAKLTQSYLHSNTFGRIVQQIDPNRQVLAIPQTLVYSDAQGFYVYTIEQGKVAKAYFSPGEISKNGLIAVRTGIATGISIINSNPDDFSVGQHVKVKP